MDKLHTLPRSMQSTVDRADELIRQGEIAIQNGNPELAVVKARQAQETIRAIAQTNPELAAAAFGLTYGHKSMTMEVIQRHEYSEVVERKVFGVTMGRDVVPMVSTTRTWKKITFGD